MGKDLNRLSGGFPDGNQHPAFFWSLGSRHTFTISGMEADIKNARCAENGSMCPCGYRSPPRRAIRKNSQVVQQEPEASHQSTVEGSAACCWYASQAPLRYDVNSSGPTVSVRLLALPVSKRTLSITIPVDVARAWRSFGCGFSSSRTAPVTVVTLTGRPMSATASRVASTSSSISSSVFSLRLKRAAQPPQWFL